MNNKQDKCKCGKVFDNIANISNITVRYNSDGKLVKVFEYRCPDCLQGYYKYLPDDIEIKND